jgi:katanin p60 ATPase-containing subunit A1
LESEIRSSEEKRELEHRRNIMVLILSYLNDHGYNESCELLQQESNCSLSKFSLADNVDLSTILKDYEEFYQFKFSKRPKIVRKVDSKDSDGVSLPSLRAHSASRQLHPRPVITPTNKPVSSSSSNSVQVDVPPKNKV